jgi:hypothetical protein
MRDGAIKGGVLMSIDTRRSFLTHAGTLALGATVLGPLVADAAGPHAHAAGGDGLALEASMTHRCGTCEFWGGMRKLAADHKLVTAQSMGWCNNPKSPQHQKLTAADHEMSLSGIWKKWGALP